MRRIEKPYIFLGLFLAVYGFFFFLGFIHGFQEARYKAHRTKQYRAVEHGDIAGAIDEATAMISTFPDRFEGYMLRGEAYASSGKHLRAITDLTTSLNRLPDDRDRAKEMDGWSIDRMTATLRYDRAIDYERTGQYARALADVEKALDFDPDMKNAHFLRGQANLGLKEYRKAADDFGWSIDHREDYLDRAYFLSAQAQAGYGNYPRAVADMHRAIEARPEVHYLLAFLGWYQFKAGQVAEAIGTDREALSFADQKDANPAFNLGLCYAVTGDEANAHAAYELGLRLPSDQQALTGAREDVTDELRIHPGNPVLLKAQQWLSGG